MHYSQNADKIVKKIIFGFFDSDKEIQLNESLSVQHIIDVTRMSSLAPIKQNNWFHMIFHVCIQCCLTIFLLIMFFYIPSPPATLLPSKAIPSVLISVFHSVSACKRQRKNFYKRKIWLSLRVRSLVGSQSNEQTHFCAQATLTGFSKFKEKTRTQGVEW